MAHPPNGRNTHYITTIRLYGLGFVLLATTGCGLTGMGAATVANPLERESADMLLWGRRGQDLGLLARTYCVAGSSQERAWMREVFNATGTPAKIMIICPQKSDD